MSKCILKFSGMPGATYAQRMKVKAREKKYGNKDKMFFLGTKLNKIN